MDDAIRKADYTEWEKTNIDLVQELAFLGLEVAKNSAQGEW
jgi:hypothetical protein